MHRLLVALLAAFDALVIAAVGVVAVFVPVSLLWVFGPGGADWSALWPAAGSVWQAAHLVPVAVHLPARYLSDAGIPAQAASFTVSLVPLALTGLTAVPAARFGLRAGRNGGWVTAAVAGTAVFAAVAVAVRATSHIPVATVSAVPSVLLPTLVFAVPVVAGAMAGAGAEGIGGALRDRLTALAPRWRELPGLAVRGAAAAVTTLVVLGALAVVVALAARSSQIITLYQAGNMDGVGALVVSLAQLAYAPTLAIWGAAFLAGPGFAVGTGTAVSPAGTSLGVVPAVPVLGAIPPSTSPWLLIVVLLPVGAGALAGWMLRARVRDAGDEPSARIVLTIAVAALSAAAAAALAGLASGALGPGRMAAVGPHPGMTAAAVGVEVLVGAGIMLLGPAAAADDAILTRARTPSAVVRAGAGPVGRAPRSSGPASTAPAGPGFPDFTGPGFTGPDFTDPGFTDPGPRDPDIAGPGFLDVADPGRTGPGAGGLDAADPDGR